MLQLSKTTLPRYSAILLDRLQVEDFSAKAKLE